MEQLKPSLKRTTNWNKYLTKVTTQQRNRYLDFLINPSFQGVNILFALSFENNGDRTSYPRYYIPLVEIKNYNVMMDWRNFFDKPIKNDLITYDNIRKIATGQGDDYTRGCLLDYPFFKNYYKMIAKDLSKQQALDIDPKAIQHISFTANYIEKETQCFSLLKKQKKQFEIFHKEQWKHCNFIFFQYNISVKWLNVKLV